MSNATDYANAHPTTPTAVVVIGPAVGPNDECTAADPSGLAQSLGRTASLAASASTPVKTFVVVTDSDSRFDTYVLMTAGGGTDTARLQPPDERLDTFVEGSLAAVAANLLAH